MGTAEKYDFGIECIGDPDAWRTRILVCGLQLLTSDQGLARGYGEREVIVPTEFWEPSDEELTAIIATEQTKHVARLVNVAAAVGERVVAVSDYDDFRVDLRQEPMDFGDGIRGFPGKFRDDPPNMLNVSKDDDELLVGEHIDVRPYPELKGAIINLGPGDRWHRVSPNFNAAPFDGLPAVPSRRNSYMRERIMAGEADSLRSYSFLLHGPTTDPATGQVMAEALVDSPVAWYLHDGSTQGLSQASRVSFIISPPGEDPWRAYPSIV